MPLDNQKFVVTANGKQIRLFPGNLLVFTRDRTPDWKLSLDHEVSEELAMRIFQTYHRGRGAVGSHDMRWGNKDLALNALNSLVTPEPAEGPNTDWEPDGHAGEQYIWYRFCDGRELYQMTATNHPPQTQAGYCNRETMLQRFNNTEKV